MDIRPPGSLDVTHRDTTSLGQRNVLCKAIGARRSPQEDHHVCGNQGKGERPLKMCYGEMRPGRGGSPTPQCFFFFFTSRDDLESMLGRNGAFIHHFSIYLLSPAVGEGLSYTVPRG
jgi:hypothetical protein